MDSPMTIDSGMPSSSAPMAIAEPLPPSRQAVRGTVPGRVCGLR
jgi:hypothetical protein